MFFLFGPLIQYPFPRYHYLPTSPTSPTYPLFPPACSTPHPYRFFCIKCKARQRQEQGQVTFRSALLFPFRHFASLYLHHISCILASTCFPQLPSTMLYQVYCNTYLHTYIHKSVSCSQNPEKQTLTICKRSQSASTATHQMTLYTVNQSIFSTKREGRRLT